ncbi:MAG: hypothetical protein AB1728_15335, partial [Bacteroidota bacterium]
LTKNFINEPSIAVFSGSIQILNYKYDKASNTLSVLLEREVSNPETLFVHYTYLPLLLKRSYSLRSLVFKPDTVKKTSKISVIQQEEVFSNIFGPELTKSGSISRGFLVGSNRDFTLSSGFRLQMAGKLSSDIGILAALTDENTPIQPQGNTQTLQEIDNVFVEIKNPIYNATLGDFQYSSSQSEFASVNRKLQGARLSADYQTLTPATQAFLVGATSRGKFHSNQFQGIEGVQGPYRMTGKNNERNIIIIAGSERVFVDGIEMVRGDNNDYSIDYGSAELTFSTRRLITGASRIVVDFEYSDRQFTRNFIGAGTSTKIGDDISLRVQYYREGDDPDSPIDLTLSDTDKEILRQSGNTPAVKSGVVHVGKDSLGIGRGNYVAVDTVINAKQIRIYRFSQNDTNSVYNVAFSSVGNGTGDYIREGIGRYRFVGIKQGQYLPIIILPSAQLHQLYSVQSTISPLQHLTVDAEFASSSFDQNRFSALGDNTNDGKGFKFGVRYSPKNVMIGSSSIGSFEFLINERYRENTFLSFDRANEVEFGRKWSTDSLLTPTSSTEEIREGKLIYTPAENISLFAGAGSLKRTKQFFSQRYEGGIDLTSEQYPNIHYYIENISGEEKINRISNTWFRQKGNIEYNVNMFTPAFRFEEENRKVRHTTTDSLAQSSYAFALYAPKMTAKDLYGLDGFAEYEWRNDKAYDSGAVVPQATSFTQSYSLTLKEVQNFSGSTMVTFREKKYEPHFQATNTNQQTTLIKVQTRYRPFSHGLDIDLFYDAATQRSAKLERIFYKVRKGEGQYVWFDEDSDGIVDVNDEREFRLDRYDGEYNALIINSDNLIPIINVKVSSKIRLTPNRIIKQPNSSLGKIFAALSSETYVRLEERSTETDVRQIYLLNLDRFLRPATTQYGFQFFQQDLHIFENRPEYSFRFRFNQRKGLSQYSSGTEKNYSRERSVRSRFLITNEVTNQTDVILKDDNALSSSLINQQRRITSSGLATDFSYRPEQNIEIGFKIETTQSEDNAVSRGVLANFNGQTVRSVIAFQGNGQLRLELTREEVLLSNSPAAYSIPFEMTSGRDLGKQYLWSASSEYKLGSNVQFSLQYSGRTTSRANVIHTGRMEVRAFF